MSNMQNYHEMFKSPIFSKTVVDQHINDARTNYKRSDMIVWFLKHYKYITITNALSAVDSSSDEFSTEMKWLSNFEKSHPSWKGNVPRISDVKSFLQHIVDLNLPEINNFRFQNESYEHVLDVMDKIETEWREQLDYEAVEEYGRKIITFPDGSAWFDLERSGCSIEADAMGHCGNGSGRPGQTLLSYRRPAGDPSDKMWSSRLTFILDTKTGALGEMKGRGNDKPAERYHPYIIALLKSDRIKKIAGGGYLPECNFSLQDLSVEDRKDLLDTKPSIFSVTELAKIYRRNLSDCPVNLSEAISDEMFTEIVEIEGVKWRKFLSDFDYDGICISFNLKNLPNYTENLDGNHMDIDHVTELEHHYNAEDVIEGFKLKHPELFSRWAEELKNNLDENDIEHLDLDSAKGLYKALLLEDGQYKDIVETALLIGDESGSMGELNKAFEAYIKSPLRETNGVMIKRIEDGDYNRFDMLVSDDYILETVSTDEINEYQCEDIKSTVMNWIDVVEKKEDLDVPRHGFSGFDEEAAIEALFDSIRENLPDIKASNTIVGVSPFGDSDNPEAMRRLSHQREASGMGF